MDANYCHNKKCLECEKELIFPQLKKRTRFCFLKMKRNLSRVKIIRI